MMSGLGKALILLGGVLLVLGGIFLVLGKWSNSEGGLGWLGRLPGDFIIKRDHVTFYFPLATSIIVSVVGSLIFYLFFRR
jgi:predicted membrane channel-forming protein YqfA (hemolysin III family)